jgi:uncharacterized integral membrane protein
MSDADRSPTTVDLGRVVRFALVALLLAGFVLVAVDNREDVRVGYIVGDATAPIWIVLVLAAVGGVMIGWLIRHRPHRQ